MAAWPVPSTCVATHAGLLMGLLLGGWGEGVPLCGSSAYHPYWHLTPVLEESFCLFAP